MGQYFTSLLAITCKLERISPEGCVTFSPNQDARSVPPLTTATAYRRAGPAPRALPQTTATSSSGGQPCRRRWQLHACPPMVREFINK